MNILDIKLEHVSEEEYNEARLKYIAEYQEYCYGGFFSPGYYKNDPVTGEAKWNNFYPEGFDSWSSTRGHTLTSYGQAELIDKLNEAIVLVNTLCARITVLEDASKAKTENVP